MIRVTLNLSPAQAQTPSSGHFYASLLYTAAHVFNFMNATMYWAVLVPLGYGSVPRGAYGGGKALGDGWLQPFCLVNMYGVTPLIASSEVLFLNTITHQHVRPLRPFHSRRMTNGSWQVVASHVCSTVLLLVGYLGWAAVGNTMTGQYPFFWMDPQVMGSPKLVAACGAGFVGMGAAGESLSASYRGVEPQVYVSEMGSGADRVLHTQRLVPCTLSRRCERRSQNTPARGRSTLRCTTRVTHMWCRVSSHLRAMLDGIFSHQDVS